MKSSMSCCLIFILGCLASASRSYAEVRLPALISDRMVIQRGMYVHLWGFADPGESVTANFQGATATGVADESGLWNLYLPPAKTGGPYSLQIRGTNTIEIKDVLVGDVWIASGQSNMELEMNLTENAKTEIAAADYPEIRLFHVQHTYSDYPLDDVPRSTWKRCTPDSVKDFSAVAYFFARDIQRDQKVPIGIVESSWGGTPVEAWTSLGALSREPFLLPLSEAWSRISEAESRSLRMQVIARRRYEAAKTEGKEASQPPGSSGLHRWAPAYLFNGMIAPLVPMPIRGVIWYQGEHNAIPLDAPLYARAFQTMITDWRTRWGQGDYPFLFVQLANFEGTADPSSWQIVRDAQRRTLSLRNTGMAVANDIGDPENIHAPDKQDVGSRLALAAKAIAYGEHIEFSGPLYRSVLPEQGSLRVLFDHTTGGLTFRGQKPVGFEIAGANGVYLPAEVKIDGDSLLLSNSAIPSPQHARCGMTGDQRCNLYNGEELPAASFITE